LISYGCGSDGEEPATVRIHNFFTNPDTPAQPPWTICEASYLGADFGKIELDQTSQAHEVVAGLDYVLMVAAWDDPSCAVEHCLPIATKNEEETVPGQERTIVLDMPNHQGPCPPEGIQPIPQAQYDRIRALYPDYGFPTYAQRTDAPQCH
jgi:hypothetical protein